MINTNIIENNQQSSLLGIIYTTNSRLTMNHCSVFKNCNNNKGKVFFPSSGSITCINCSMTEDQMKSTYKLVTINTASESFINQYSFLNLDECQGTIDIWKTPKESPKQTPTETPKRTPEQTPKQTIQPTETPEQVNSFNLFNSIGFFDF